MPRYFAYDLIDHQRVNAMVNKLMVKSVLCGSMIEYIWIFVSLYDTWLLLNYVLAACFCLTLVMPHETWFTRSGQKEWSQSGQKIQSSTIDFEPNDKPFGSYPFWDFTTNKLTLIGYNPYSYPKSEILIFHIETLASPRTAISRYRVTN